MEAHNDSAGQESERGNGDERLTSVQGKPFTARIEALINAISQYRDVYPVLQRGVQFLCQVLCNESCGNTHNEEVVRVIQLLVESETLEDTISAMADNLDSPTFIRSCFELLAALVDKASELVAGALWKTDILVILNKIVHSVMYQNEPACVQLGINLLSKLVWSLDSIGNELWAQLVAIAAQAMLANSLDDDGLQLECLINLKLLFQLKSDTTVPATSSNIILKTVDQYNRQATEISKSFVSASVVVVSRIFEASSRTSHLGYSAPILAAVLHHYQLSIGLNETHKLYVEKHIQQPLQAAVNDSLTRLVELALPSAESNTEICLNSLQNAAMKLLLCVVWREEACAFVNSGGVAVLTTIFASEFVSNAAIKTALAQTLYYVSVHWPDEMWNEIQTSGSSLMKWLNAITERCEDEGRLHYLLAMIKALLNCKGFRKEYTANKGVEIFNLVLHKHRQLPLCTRLIVNILLSAPDICPATYLTEFCCSVADAMFSFEANRSIQLECVTALTLLISHQPDREIALSTHHVHGIIRVMRSNLTDAPFTAKMLGLVASTLLDPSTRAALIDGGLLQVVSKAICTHQWSPSESVGMNARHIICDAAHKLDVFRNLSTLEPLANAFSGHSFSSPAISLETLDACCSMIGALACVNPLLPLLIEEGAIKCMICILRFCKQEVIVRSEDSFIQLVNTCFYALSSVVNAPIVLHAKDSAAREDILKALDGYSIYSQLADSGAEDTIIGCLEEALRVKNPSSVLVDGGCRLLRTVLTFSTIVCCETESRWIAVATSILQRHSTQPKTRELLFATTLMVLSRGKNAVEGARGQHIKMMKVILGILDDSIQHESSCVLFQAECAGAIRVLEELAKQSNSVADTLCPKVPTGLRQRGSFFCDDWLCE
ncbi:hypothetical protein V7S43_006981 [Phytophthora oleae]|uniref:Uncharacterized protein n=1 Tax=Phytophthora oleae TaxID=2107226 RepID=A0ABD3FMK9_9STRA